MNHIEIPEWMKQTRDAYDRDPVRWTWIGMTTLVVILAGVMLFYMVRKQKNEASELITRGMQALDQGNYVSAVQNFQRVQKSLRLSGFSDEATLLSGAALFGLERYAEAEAAYKAFLESDPSNELAPEAEMGIGACRELQDDMAGALAVYKAALQKHPTSFLSKAIEIRIARLSRQTGEIPMAAAIYNRLEGDSEGLWREISRGNRRLILSPEAAGSGSADSGIPTSRGSAVTQETAAGIPAPAGR